MNEFDYGFDEIDHSYLDNDDFGTPNSFTTAPVFLIAPQASLKKNEAVDIEHAVENIESNEIKAEGFCFRMHPAEDQV